MQTASHTVRGQHSWEGSSIEGHTRPLPELVGPCAIQQFASPFLSNATSEDLQVPEMSVCALHCSGYPMNPVYSCNPSGVSMGRGQDFFAGSDGRSSQTSAHNLEGGGQVHPSKYLAGLPVEFCMTPSRRAAAPPLLPYPPFHPQGFPGLQASRAFSLPELSPDPFWGDSFSGKHGADTTPGQHGSVQDLMSIGSHPDVRKVEELAARCAQAGRPRHPLGSPLTAAHFASVPDLSAYTQACHEFLPHSAALPVQPPWNGQPLPIEQGMGAAPELTPLPSIGLSDMEELGLMEPRQAPAPEEPIQAVARRLSEPAAEAAEPPHAQECATTVAAPGEAWSPMSRGRSKEPSQAPPAHCPGASAGSWDAKQGMPRIPDGQAAAQAATDSQAECASCAWDGTHPQSSADGPGAGQPRAAGQEASGALSVDSAAQRGSGGRAACEAVLRNRKIQKVYLERKKSKRQALLASIQELEAQYEELRAEMLPLWERHIALTEALPADLQQDEVRYLAGMPPAHKRLYNEDVKHSLLQEFCQEPRAVYEALVGAPLTTHQQHLVRERPVGPIKDMEASYETPEDCESSCALPSRIMEELQLKEPQKDTLGSEGKAILCTLEPLRLRCLSAVGQLLATFTGPELTLFRGQTSSPAVGELAADLETVAESCLVAESCASVRCAEVLTTRQAAKLKRMVKGHAGAHAALCAQVYSECSGGAHAAGEGAACEEVQEAARKAALSERCSVRGVTSDSSRRSGAQTLTTASQGPAGQPDDASLGMGEAFCAPHPRGSSLPSSPGFEERFLMRVSSGTDSTRNVDSCLVRPPGHADPDELTCPLRAVRAAPAGRSAKRAHPDHQVVAQRFQSFPGTAAASLDAVVPSMSGDDTHNAAFPSASVHAQPAGRNAATEARPAKKLARLPQRKSPGHVAQSRASA